MIQTKKVSAGGGLCVKSEKPHLESLNGFRPMGSTDHNGQFTDNIIKSVLRLVIYENG